MNRLLYLLFIVACWSCTNSSEVEKHQNKRDNIINVRQKIKEIKIEDVLISGSNRLQLMNDYLIISDYNSIDKLIHLFDKNSFNYLTSTTYRGQGPGEIANLGYVAVNEPNRLFYVTDHGKQKIFTYNLDSVLADSLYMPKDKLKMNERQFPSEYQYINDTLCIGRIIEPIGNSDFKPSVAKWNMTTGEIKLMKYEHPEIEKKRISFAVSMAQGIYVECYSYHDLMTICDLNGDLKYNIYGSNWNNRKSNKISYYGNVAFCGDKIWVTYSGEDTFSKDPNGRIKSNNPTMFLVFDINGDYIQTLETGYNITHFCYDKEKNRIIMSLNDEIQFAYLDLDGLI